MFWKAKNQNEKNLSNAMDKFKKANNVGDQVKLIKEFINYTPDYTFIILYRHARKLIDLLLSSNSDDEPSNSVIDLIFTMVERYNIFNQKMQEESKNSTDATKKKSDEKALKKKNQECFPYDYLIKENAFYDNLFQLTKKADERVLGIIEGVYKYEPVSFTEWLHSKKDIRKCTFMNFIQMVIDTKDQRSAKLLHLLSVSHPNILKSLEPIFIPIMKKLPLSAVLDLMMASKDIKNSFPSDDFQVWLLESQNEYTISDLEMISNFFNEIWLSETMIKMLASSKPPEKMSDIFWISRKDPQNFDIPQNIVREACNSIEDTSKVVFVESSDCESTRDPYFFIRLYILSLSNPERVTFESQNLVTDLIKDSNPFVAAAATQCLISWITRFDYQIKFSQASVYRLAYSTFSENIDKALRYIYYACLHVLGKNFQVAAAIIQADENIRFKPEYKKFIIRESWCFPHIRKSFNLINQVKFVDFNQAKTIIDVVSSYFSDHVDEECEYEYEYEYETV
ncbi:hypothetical protein M9Y10_015987 [Tritrichomonas musculus]|uniref:Uncharacterized protein n=1 Tax=Tritrichomonas musculus TaxID=1915356 RepID=A0ABR2I6W2_9EUKA